MHVISALLYHWNHCSGAVQLSLQLEIISVFVVRQAVHSAAYSALADADVLGAVPTSSSTDPSLL
jgi:hypothetical protein